VPTPAERRALLFFAFIAAAGAGVRGYRALAGEPVSTPESRRALTAQLAAVDSAARAEKGKGKRSTRKRGSPSPQPPTPDPRAIDLDLATESDLTRLPRVGPQLARRIIADRDSLGPFGSIEALARVKGIGPATAKRLAPHVTFSLPPRPPNAVIGGRVTPERPGRRRTRGG
jgi:competence protein ComEA